MYWLRVTDEVSHAMSVRQAEFFRLGVATLFDKKAADAYKKATSYGR